MADPSRLVVPRSSDLLFLDRKFKADERIVQLPNGKRVRVWTDDSRTTRQIEENDALHAVVRPKTVHFQVLRSQP